MIKRIALLSLIGIIIIGATIYFIAAKQVKVVDSMFKAIPLDAAYIVDIADYNDFRDAITSGNKCWNAALELTFLKSLKNQIQLLDSLQHQSAVIKNLFLQKHAIMISGHPSGKVELQCVFYFKIPSKSDFKSVESLIQSGKKFITGYSRSYEGVTIQDLVSTEKKGIGFSYTWINGIMILSASSILLENTVRQINAVESILSKNGLNEIVKTAGKSAVLNFYLNFDQLPRLANRFIHLKYKKDINFLRNLGSWAELDLSIKSDILIFNGFSFASNLNSSFESIFKNQKPVKLEIFEKIPNTANTFGAFGINNLEQYIKDCAVFMEAHGEGTDAKETLLQIKAKNNIDLLNDFHNFYDSEAGFVFLESSGDTVSKYCYSLIKIKNKEDGLSILNNWISTYSEKNNIDPTNLKQEITLEGNNKITVFTLPFGNLPNLLFGKMFGINDNRYCYISDNYLIFGYSPEKLKFYENQLINGATLRADKGFNNFSEYFSSQSNFFFYNLPGRSTDIYNNFFNKEIAGDMLIDKYKLQQFQAFVYQFNIGDNGLIYNNIFLKCNSSATTNKFKTSWELQLNAPLISAPVQISNSADNETQLAVKDTKNNVYLINNNGHILWKMEIPEPIISEIKPIDYYKNGKIQIIFNTRSKIYIIDKNGNNIENYPLILNSPATNALLVVDYDNKKEYRFIYASENNKINVLSKKGEPLTTWVFNKTDSKVTQSIQYFRVEEKDLLTFTDLHNLYVIDRKGKELIHTNKSYNISSQNKISLINSRSLNEVKFLFTDSSGNIIQVGLNKQLQETSLLKVPANHWFDVYDIDGDGIKDLIFTWGNTMKIISQKNKDIFTINIEKPISYRPVFYNISKDLGQCVIGLVSIENNNIYLFDNKGILLEGLPLKGNTQFSIEMLRNSENSFNLNVGSINNFLYEYSVQ